MPPWNKRLPRLYAGRDLAVLANNSQVSNTCTHGVQLRAYGTFVCVTYDVYSCSYRTLTYMYICMAQKQLFNQWYIYTHVCISYVTAVRYVAAINHETRGRAAPEGE